MFFGIFSESSNTTGCRFGYNPGRGGVQHASLQLAFEAKMAQKQLQVGDMEGKEIKIFQFFLKTVQRFGGEKLIISGGEDNFLKKFRNGVTFSGCFCDNTSGDVKFF